MGEQAGLNLIFPEGKALGSHTVSWNIQFIYKISTSLTKSKNDILYTFGFEILINSSSYVKEKIKMYSHVTLMIRILGMFSHPSKTSCGF